MTIVWDNATVHIWVDSLKHYAELHLPLHPVKDTACALRLLMSSLPRSQRLIYASHADEARNACRDLSKQYQFAPSKNMLHP